MEPMHECKDITDHLNKGGRFTDLIETVPAQDAVDDETGAPFSVYIEEESENEEFVIPNVLARGERLLVTAYEGHGKSKLLRQFAVQLAAGIHPWTGLEMPPQKVLYIDAENSKDQVRSSWRMLAGLAAYHGRMVDDKNLVQLWKWQSEPDLTSNAGAQWLMERIHGHQPDVVCMGPLYNMVGRDPKDEEVVRKLKAVVNAARGICGSAFIMEHHAPLKEQGAMVRSIRPYGSSIFLRWPDFGFGLLPVPDNEGVYEWSKFRFPRVRERQFPTHLRWGKPNTAEWPWTPCEMDGDGNIY
jgi:RecA-family ATPase